MAVNVNFGADKRIFLGEDKMLRFAIYASEDINGVRFASDAALAAGIVAGTAVPVSMTSVQLVWMLRNTDDAADPPLISKSSPATGLTVVGTYNANPVLNTQRVQVDLYDTDSYDPTVSPAVALRARAYRHALKRLVDGIETVLAFGDFVFLPSLARE